jgi:hypothetical protein
MKLGIFLLIFGLLIAGAGAYTWQYYNPTFLGYRTQEAQQFFVVNQRNGTLFEPNTFA